MMHVAGIDLELWAKTRKLLEETPAEQINMRCVMKIIDGKPCGCIAGYTLLASGWPANTDLIFNCDTAARHLRIQGNAKYDLFFSFVPGRLRIGTEEYKALVLAHMDKAARDFGIADRLKEISV